MASACVTTLAALPDSVFLEEAAGALTAPSALTPATMTQGEDIARQMLVRCLMAGDATLAAAVIESMLPPKITSGVMAGFAKAVSDHLVHAP